MTSVQDRLKLKRASFDTWSTREQLCLASSVLKSGDQNWMSVSRSLKPFAEKEALRPPDWFSQKSCAIQYAHLLENADTPKRKKRDSGETTGESIVRRLTQERIAELRQILAFQRDEYQQLKADVNLLKWGSVTEEKLQKMWLTIEQEEREQEQKAIAHTAWLAKRQQKQEIRTLSNVSIGNKRKPTERITDTQDTIEPVCEEDDKKNRGSKSPLLTSLLKSPSPTTQMQNSSNTQVNSPTIASLLGSSPKVPNSQPTQISQLPQIVTTSVANTVPERPSAGAPTLSMLLEMPANSQRGPLPNLQTPTILNQSNVPAETQIPIQSVNQGNIQPDNTLIHQRVAPSRNVPVTESMVQIIDHMDDVIHKDIMADVIDKDEINEIIGDIEELLKEEITRSPQTSEGSSTVPIIKEIPVSQLEQVVVSEKPEPRDVDEAVSLSNSPQSEMAIEEIDSSTSNIAEIIGTVAIEPIEPKVFHLEVPEPVSVDNNKTEPATIVEKPVTNDSIVEMENSNEKVNKEVIVEKETTFDNQEVEKVGSEKLDKKSTDSKEPVNKIQETVVSEKAESIKEISAEIEKNKIALDELNCKESSEVDQIEMSLAKITGDQESANSPSDVNSNASEPENDIPSIEDSEKSQDISLMLEDCDSSSNSEKKKLKESSASGKTEIIQNVELPKEKATNELKETVAMETVEEVSSFKLEEQSEENSKLQIANLKKEAFKEFLKDKNSVLQDVEIKKEGEEKTVDSSMIHDLKEAVTEKVGNVKKQCAESMKGEKENTEQAKISMDNPKSEDKNTENSKVQIHSKISEQPKKEEIQIKEESGDNKKVDEPIVKKEVTDFVGSAGEDSNELDEEDSTIIKLSGVRAMKTYSKKQNIAIDSEPENEGTGEGAEYRAWKKAVMLVYNRLVTHKYASVFSKPITEDQAPGYHSVIFRPMDLTTIKKNIDNGTIRSTMHFQRDVMLMFQNAIMYNKHDTIIYKMAVSMQEECLQHMQILVQVTGEGTFRRETRTAASSNSDFTENVVKRKRSHITPSPHDTESPRSKKRRKSEND
ncbi:bromodomain-containing protein 8 [Prorops nasuta]|uniref:bromodomain-containing protein 8 n=1 Tax=Prorops nasuta TaxID=863751 RepID=UPI0034CFA470